MTSFARKQVLAYRLRANDLAGPRLPAGSLAVAARGGLQDGSPLSGLLSLAARVEGVERDDWRHESLAQVFGPRGAVYLVPAEDVGVFTLGLLPRVPERLIAIEHLAARVHAVLAGESMSQSEVLSRLPDLGGSRALRWGAALGTLVATWDTVDTIVHPAPPPHIDPEEARLELARRFFRYLGPATVKDLQWWLDGTRRDAVETVMALGDSLTTITVEGRECLVLTKTVDELLDADLDPDNVRLPPPDDVYINRLHRGLLVPNPDRRRLLWPQAPPPGALVIGGEVRGTWRRRGGSVDMSPWQEVLPRHRRRTEEVAAEWPMGDDVASEVTWREPVDGDAGRVVST